MNPSSSLRRTFLLTLALAVCAAPPPLAAQDTTSDLIRNADARKIIPISLSGFTGEADRVLRYDLEILGFKVVSADEAAFVLTGSADGGVQGTLTLAKAKTTIFSKRYNGGTARTQAHALADDVIEEARGKGMGIARTEIAFKGAVDGASEVFIADYDGHNVRQVTRDGSIVASPSWVPGQRALAYNSYKSGFPDIYSHNLSTGARHTVARHSGSNITPAVSPDGRRVAMILSKGGAPNLYVAALDGTGLRQLTRTKEGESCPTWSPDGSTICIVSRVNGRGQLFTVPSAGGEMKRLPTGTANATEPDWSPDGKKIAFTTQTGAGFDIRVLELGKTLSEVLVPGADPSWAPNSRTIIFTRDQGRGRRGLSLLDAPTRHVKDAAQFTGSHSQPVWAR